MIAVLVEEIMNKCMRSVIPETSIAEAMDLMRFYKIESLPVTINKEIVGIVQLREILTLFFSEENDGHNEGDDCVSRHQLLYAPLVRADVKNFMDKSIRSVSPSRSVNEAMSIMRKEHVCSLAVTEDNKVVGMISFDDINKAVLGLTSTNVSA